MVPKRSTPRQCIYHMIPRQEDIPRQDTTWYQDKEGHYYKISHDITTRRDTAMWLTDMVPWQRGRRTTTRYHIVPGQKGTLLQDIT